jgi:M6 family metalloprotease-like protein
MKRNLSILASFLIAAGTAAAMPPRPGLQEPAAIVTARAEGRIDNPANGLIFELRSKAGGAAKISGSRSYPVVLGFFTDTGSTYTSGQLQAMLFSTGNGVKSVNNYYRDMSFNAMSCSGSVASWYTTGNTVNYFGGGSNGFNSGTTANVYDFIRKTLVHADSFVDFSDPAYDLNSDGYVDVLWVIHAGRGGEEEYPNNGNWIWSHSSSLSGWGGGATYFTTNDPWTGHAGQYVKINKYIIMPEKTLYSASGNTMIGSGVFAHEFGHALGLPDLYDVALASNGIEGQGLGLFSLMAAGSWGGDYSSGARPVALDAWSRRFLGWLAPTLVTANNRFTINASLANASGSSYKLARLGRDTTKQYWLVENRYRNAAGTFSSVRWDSLLYGQGLLVYHVDTTYTSGTYFSTNHVNSNSTNGSSRNRPYGVALEETDMTSAGYRSELWNSTNYGEAADIWNSSTQAAFDSNGTAYPVTYLNGTDSITGGAHTLVAIRAIPAASAAMACSLFVGVASGVAGGPVALPPPTGFQLDEARPNPARGAVTFGYRLPAANDITVEIFNLAGQLVERAAIGRQPAGRHDYQWLPPAKSQGVYFFRLRAGGASLTTKFIVLH